MKPKALQRWIATAALAIALSGCNTLPTGLTSRQIESSTPNPVSTNRQTATQSPSDTVLPSAPLTSTPALEPAPIAPARDAITPTNPSSDALFLPQCQLNSAHIPTPPVSLSPRLAGWLAYTHPIYGFSFDFSPDWTLVEGPHYLCLNHKFQNLTLIVGYKRFTESANIQRSGIGAGDVVTRGWVSFMGQSASRNILVHQGKDKAVLYNNAEEIRVDDLVFTLSLDDFRRNDYEAIVISPKVQKEVDQIVESFVR